MNTYSVLILCGLFFNLYSNIGVTLTKTSDNNIKCSINISAYVGTGCWPALVKALSLRDDNKQVLSLDQINKYSASQLIDDNVPHLLVSSRPKNIPGSGQNHYIFNFFIPQAAIEESGVGLFFNFYRAANPELTGGKKFTLCGETLTALEMEVQIRYEDNKVVAYFDNKKLAELIIVKCR